MTLLCADWVALPDGGVVALTADIDAWRVIAIGPACPARCNVRLGYG